MDIKRVVDSICREVGVSCFRGDEDNPYMHHFVLSWYETWHFLDGLSVKDLQFDGDAAEKLLEIHAEAYKLALKGQYIYTIDEKRFIEIAKKLAKEVSS